MKGILINRRSILVILALSLLTSVAYGQKRQSVASPNGRLRAEVVVDKDSLHYQLFHDGEQIMQSSTISMTLEDGRVYGAKPRLKRASTKEIDEVIESPVYKRSRVKDNYNELKLEFRGDYNIIFRAYDEGVAYRFVSLSTKPFVVVDERAEFIFAPDSKAWIPYVKDEGSIDSQLFNSFENDYDYGELSNWSEERLAFLPILIEGRNGRKIAITEADLLNYPGMYLYNETNGGKLKGLFAKYPKELKQGGHNNLQMVVEERESYIAKYDRGTAFPWRVIVVSDSDMELIDSDIVYSLASPSRIADGSWIKPGKVAWEWWNDWNLYGVDFETGVNNETYKYYIDFASEYGMEYVILDEGWTVREVADLFDVVPEIDLEMLIEYAEERNVGIILWAGYWAFDREMERVCRDYSEMGVKGFKIDFMDRDDQPMVDFHLRAAETAARYELLVNFHGTYKPTGLQRTYPNVINFEGVNGLEQMKWSNDLDQVTYDVTIPFIRMLAGPMDYTQGAMRNATRHNYSALYSEAMSQGTRGRQLAQFVIFESPLSMLCDSPSNYMREEECARFIADIPTVWDESVALAGEVGEYVAIARQSGDEWYVAGMTNWDIRSVELDLSFLGDGRFEAELFRDGLNADRVAKDYKREIIELPLDKRVAIDMASGGGFVMKVYRKLPKVVAHRGYWKTEGSAQNSITSLVKADSIGCYGSELDVWMTADDFMVANHDRVFKGVAMDSSTKEEVLAVELNNGENIPAFKDILRKMKELPDIRLILEIKTLPDESRIPLQAAIIVDMLRNYQVADRTDVIGFSRLVCEEFIERMPEVKVYYLNGELSPAQLKEQGYAGLDYNQSVLRRRPHWVEEAQELGLEVNVWTVNSEESMREFIDMGVDYITTDEPELLQKVIASYMD